MSHYRRDLRNVARGIITAAPYFDGFTYLPAWAQMVDPAALPAFSFATPREPKIMSGLEEAERQIDLVLIIKRTGGDDLDDILDEDSHAAEVALLTGLRAATYHMAQLTLTEMRIDAGGEARVATLVMTFQVRVWTDEPLT